MFHAWLIDYFLRIVEKGAFQGSFSLRRKFLNKICLECDAHKSIRFLELWGGDNISSFRVQPWSGFRFTKCFKKIKSKCGPEPSPGIFFMETYEWSVMSFRSWLQVVGHLKNPSLVAQCSRIRKKYNLENQCMPHCTSLFLRIMYVI